MTFTRVIACRTDEAYKNNLVEDVAMMPIKVLFGWAWVPVRRLLDAVRVVGSAAPVVDREHPAHRSIHINGFMIGVDPAVPERPREVVRRTRALKMQNMQACNIGIRFASHHS